MSLRWRVALSMALLAVLATIAIGAVGYRTTRDQLLEEVDRSLADVETVLREEIVDRGRLPQRGPWTDLDARVIRGDGTVVESTFPVELPLPDAAATTSRRPSDRYDTVATDQGDYRVRTVSFRRGAIQVGRPLDDVDRVLGELRVRVVAWSLVVGAIACGLGWLIASRITSSLRRLTDAAELVESTDRLDVDVGAAGRDEVGRLTSAFDRMLSALRRSRDQQRRLVEDAGHELRTPLTSLRANIDALARYPDMDASDRDAIVADLSAETAELTALVDEIVAVASGERSDEPFESIDLDVLVDEVARRFERRTGRRIVTSGSSRPVVAQPAAIQRAVSCLLDNARKFDPSDAAIEVVVDAASVTVSDRGPGIDPADVDRIFDRFYRSDAARSQPGSGLGLSIVAVIVERHGGTAFARQREGGGSEIGFSLSVLPPPGSVGGTDP